MRKCFLKSEVSNATERSNEEEEKDKLMSGARTVGGQLEFWYTHVVNCIY
jgi:hypothetical protein